MSSPSKTSAFTLVIVLTFFAYCTALSEGEKEAIDQLTSKWPFLRHLQPPWTSNASEACNGPFKGLICSDDPDEHILSLSVVAYESVVEIPESISAFLWLRNLSIGIKGLSARIPDVFGNFTKLELLELDIVQEYTGALPSTLSLLENLKELNLVLPGYVGVLPDLSKLKRLSSLLLLHLSLSSPDSFCNLNQLVELDLSGSSIGGHEVCTGLLQNLEVLRLKSMPSLVIPFKTIVSGRSKLSVLDLSSSPVVGLLDLTEQKFLKKLRLESTSISGSVPPALWENTHLEVLDLYATSITGTIPSAIGQLSNLRFLRLAITSIHGEIPREIGSCRSLKTISIADTLISGTLPAEIGNLSQLEEIDISSCDIRGPIPASFSQLSSLTSLIAGDCHLEGAIPEGLVKLPKLEIFDASRNRLSGTIPEFSPSLKEVMLEQNELIGTIHPSILAHTQKIDLSVNRLSGTIISTSPSLHILRLQRNDLTGSLPIISSANRLTLDFSDNRFSGSIPLHYQDLVILSISLRNNSLEGDATPLLGNPLASEADLSSNQFNGTLPSVFSSTSFQKLSLSRNQLTGTLPRLPLSMKTFRASHNLLQGNLDQIWLAKVDISSLRVLDLSHNAMSGSLPSAVEMSRLTFLSLAFNQFSGSISSDLVLRMPEYRLQYLDLSSNRLNGRFPSSRLYMNPLSTLLLSNNSFTGDDVTLYDTPEVTIMDISNNDFNFSLSSLGFHPSLSFFFASHNRLSGTLALHGMSSLRTIDVSYNQVSEVNFLSISELALKYKLNSLIMTNVPIQDNSLPTLLNSGALMRTKTISRSDQFRGVSCTHLTFATERGNTFEFDYDEKLFDYQQCECDRDHFGIPPLECHPCSVVGSNISLCQGYDLKIDSNNFIFEVSVTSPLEVEPCIHEAYRVVGSSNCLGLKIKFSSDGPQVFSIKSGDSYGKNEPNLRMPSSAQLAFQCRQGSSGRLCSRCDCDVNSICYFAGAGNLCKPCGKVFEPKVFVPVSLAALVIVTAILSISFYLILASKRSLKNVEWQNLSISKRFVYRLIHLSTLGQITIMVTFVQIVIEVTHWDAYALSSWLKLINGESEGIGLRCFFPFLSNPMALLLLRLFFPFGLIGIVCASIGFAELFHRMKTRTADITISELESDFEASERLQEVSLLQGEPRYTKSSLIVYPALALASSTSISIIKFFYFGTTMATFEYLFYSVQKSTGKKYVQSVPWMLYGEAHTLQMISIPFAVLFLLGIPSVFVLMSWKLRHKISSPFVRLFFGSIFENFRNHLFWWELVNVFRKLLVALFLRGLSPNNSLQPMSTSFLLASLSIFTVVAKPWKMSYENIFDSAGLMLIVFSLASGRLGMLENSKVVEISFLVMDIVYVLMNLGIIVWRTCYDETSYEKEWNLRFGVGADPINPVTDYGPPLMSRNEIDAQGFSKVSDNEDFE